MIRYIFKVFLLVLFLLRDSPVAAELVALEDEASSENTGGDRRRAGRISLPDEKHRLRL
jgi:hypothetical protein